MSEWAECTVTRLRLTLTLTHAPPSHLVALVANQNWPSLSRVCNPVGTGPRLLVDYPEPSRTDLLDFLFLPHHGASLDILKLEIGGQGDSTTGTESSHEPHPGVFDFHSGYEWFMMTEAVKRNPNITIYGLAWSFPSWLYHGSNASACHDDWVGCVNGTAAADYIAEWVDGARRVHGVHVSYVGFQNESPWRPEWVVDLRAALDKRGLHSTK